MKTSKAIQAMSCVLAIMVSTGTYAQASNTDASAQSDTAQSAKAMHKTDRALARKVHGALAKAEGISAANVVVRAKSGSVILEGTVPEQEQVAKATQIAQGVQGVTSVKNALSIRPVGQ
jgi:osmotically-inducible protein OsmY